MSHSDPTLLAAFLADSDARCPACGYALRGGTSDKCPECGSRLMLEIASTNGSAWWLAGILGLSASAVLTFLGVLGLSQMILNELQRPGIRSQVRAGFAPQSELPSWTPIILLAALLLLITLALARLATRRLPFMHWSWRRRMLIGLLAAASPLITLAVIPLIAIWR